MSIFLIGLNVLCVVVETRDATVKARFCPKQRWSRSAQVGRPWVGRRQRKEGGGRRKRERKETFDLDDER